MISHVRWGTETSKNVSKMTPRKIFKHFLCTNFFMFILLLSNQTVFYHWSWNLHLLIFLKSKLNLKPYDYLYKVIWISNTLVMVRMMKVPKYKMATFQFFSLSWMYGKKNTVLCYNQADNEWQLSFNDFRKLPHQFSFTWSSQKMVSGAFEKR